ncbi:arylsulfatase [Pontibacter sp. E15-1]|uniref:arylsulfatase n=1 Tax=Pontibacter sp. E15-1 TaxID=2919918 RepID=UPI001F4F4320|nr:arylsulfatase [Pontibacter sp. E15-1]MCJ8164239.1 arylsulfatase [Pontibacter sp. E15-1]
MKHQEHRGRVRYTIALLFLLFATSAIAQKKPNVVLILTDDQGWGDLSLHGNPWVETPQLDQLARSGERFENFYVSPLCAPSRASILTGRYSLQTGVVSVSKGLEVMDTDETTLAELFKANGYKTGIFGKWHNGQHYPNRPNDQGFDEFLGFSAGHWSNYFNTDLDHNGKTVKTKGYITDVLTDAALQFMASSGQEPFFCYIPYNAPHTPHQVPDTYFEKYKAKGLSDELASIYGMVENVDDNVGRVLRYLKDKHLEENTIVIFLSDNGPNGVRYNGAMRGIKGSVHEGGVRVPFFISWKNHIPAGKIMETPMAHVDLYPTLFEMCQLEAVPGKPLDGMSFAPMILRGSEPPAANRKIFTHVNFMEVPVTINSGGFRDSQYRFAYESGSPQLYDLLQDPEEKNDLSRQKTALANQYTKAYQQWFNGATSSLKLDRPLVLSAMGVTLPVYEATLSAGIRFKEGHGWAHDWVEKWPGTEDSLYWEIDCQKPGKYLVEMEYLCADENVGSRIVCSIGKQSKAVSIREPFSSEQLPSPDRVPRKEAYEMQEWKALRIGTFQIPAGKHVVKLKALRVKNENVAEVKGLRLKFVENQ